MTTPLTLRLVNMPFAALTMPSLALTQLRSRVEERLGARVHVETHYLNYDMARYLGGRAAYDGALTLEGLNSGIGDWLFRHVAFPEEPDNTPAYLARYFGGDGEAAQEARRFIADKRPGLEAFLEEVIDRHSLDRADVVGFTSFFSQNVACFAMARLLKRRRPELVTVLGGPNCEAEMGQAIIRHVAAVDYVFSGPALVSFPEFMVRLADGDAGGCEGIDGVISRRNLAAVKAGTVASLGMDLPIDTPVPLDYQPFLDAFRAHFPKERPEERVEPVLFFETSRGCWWGDRSHCMFCGLNGETLRYRAMAPTAALDQFERLFRYAPDVTRFDAVDNIMPRAYVDEVLPHLQTPAGVRLFYEVKADLSDAQMAVLARSGVRLIQPGIEALNTDSLKLMRKGITARHNIAFLKNCLKHDVFPIWNLLIGFPGEAEDVYSKYVDDLPSLVHLPPPGGVFPIRFDRFSPYFTRAAEFGLHLKPFDYYALTYPFPEEALDDLAYYFLDHNGAAEYAARANRWLPALREGLGRWIRLWYGAGRAGPPVLHREGTGDTVLDTRSGDVRRHRLEPADIAILSTLSDRIDSVAMVRTALGDAAPADLDDRVAAMRRSGLIFAERDRLLSLVLDGPTPLPGFDSLPWNHRAKPRLVRRERTARPAVAARDAR